MRGVQFTGTYTQLVIAGNRNDGIGMQVGYDAPPPPVVSLVCTPELLKDSANQEPVCQITATGPVPNDVAVALTVTTSAGSRYTSNCPAARSCGAPPADLQDHRDAEHRGWRRQRDRDREHHPRAGSSACYHRQQHGGREVEDGKRQSAFPPSYHFQHRYASYQPDRH